MVQSKWMYLAYFVQACIAFNVLLALVWGEMNAAITGIIMFVMGMIPYIVSKQTKVKFPWFVYFFISLALLIHISGYIQERYIDIPNWDTLAHTVSGSIICLLGFIGILFLDKWRNYNLDDKVIAVLMVMFAMCMEYLWEIYEFLVDQFYGGSLAGKMQADNTDTMMDMIFVFVPSIIVAIGCYYYMHVKGKEEIMDNMVKDSIFFK